MLGLDALWQLLGFFLGWAGASGKGLALGLGQVKLAGRVLPTVRKVVYGIDIKRIMRSKLVLGVADGWLSADGSVIYRAFDLKVRSPKAMLGVLKAGDHPIDHGVGASAGLSAKVLLLNDDYTPMGFVVLVLERVFDKDCHADYA
jgi:hypothetical protein